MILVRLIEVMCTDCLEPLLGKDIICSLQLFIKTHNKIQIFLNQIINMCLCLPYLESHLVTYLFTANISSWQPQIYQDSYNPNLKTSTTFVHSCVCNLTNKGQMRQKYSKGAKRKGQNNPKWIKRSK
jgi:hypothetical protein